MRRRSKQLDHWGVCATAGILTAFIASAASASVTRQIGLEEAVLAADAIVLGKVTENPEEATVEDGQPLRRQRVLVSTYLEGTGPSEIVVLSFGGRYTTWIPGIGLRQIEAIDGSDCRLPAVGSDVLLFLRRRGEAFRVASATHGIVPIGVDPATGRVSVRLLLDDFDNLSPSGRNAAANLALKASGQHERFADTVDVAQLAQLIRNVKQRATPRAKPR